jgi:hypothetical protein
MQFDLGYHCNYYPINLKIFKRKVYDWITREDINRACKFHSHDNVFSPFAHVAYDSIINGKAVSFIFKKGKETRYTQNNMEGINRDLMIRIILMNRYLVRGKIYALHPSLNMLDISPILKKMYMDGLAEFNYSVPIESIDVPLEWFSMTEINQIISLSQVFPFVFNAK